MERAEHAARLRLALAQAGMSQEDLATALGVSTRTVVNWMSRTKPMVPNDATLANLGRLLPGYADGGDPVEVAINKSELLPWQRTELISRYQRYLYEGAEAERRGGA